ncbi:trigger factor [Candidatus Saccharibacteria bacterium]|nr:MAG: trigger factor [Candidatus Saccharibacteria bacterium]
MQVSLTKPTETKAKLQVVAADKELQVVLDAVLTRYRDKVKLPGFRPGHAPLPMVQKSVDQAALQNDFLNDAVNQMYFLAVQEKRLRTTGNPQVEVVKFVPFSTLEFTAEVDVVGDVKLPDYKKISAKKEAVSVTADDVKQVVESLRQRSAERKSVERAAKDGDEVVLDFAGKDAKGEPVPGAEAKGYGLQLGSKSFIPGFEDAIVGLKAGAEKTFTLPFPKDYAVSALAGKKVTFEVKVQEVKELALPKLDDAFAATVGPFKTVDELKTDIKKELTAQKEREAQAKYENAVVQDIAEKTKVALPDSVVDAQVDRLKQEDTQNAMYRGQSWDEYLKAQDLDDEKYRAQKRPQAELQVKASLALAEIAEAEKIDVTPEELDAQLEALKQRYTDAKMQEELSKPEARRDIASRILTEKTIAHLVGKKG